MSTTKAKVQKDNRLQAIDATKRALGHLTQRRITLAKNSLQKAQLLLSGGDCGDGAMGGNGTTETSTGTDTTRTTEETPVATV